MSTPSLSDLRRLFYGGGSDEEYQFLLDAEAAGVTASDILEVVQSGSTAPSDAQALVDAHSNLTTGTAENPVHGAESGVGNVAEFRSPAGTARIIAVGNENEPEPLENLGDMFFGAPEGTF